MTAPLLIAKNDTMELHLLPQMAAPPVPARR